MHAAHTQRETAETICGKPGWDYLMTVKGNQPSLQRQVYGGYDPVDLARGVTVAGSPLFWLVSGERLYLFAHEDARDSFAANPAPYLKEAKARWPALEEQLAQ